jgi:hypothetical protein
MSFLFKNQYENWKVNFKFDNSMYNLACRITSDLEQSHNDKVLLFKNKLDEVTQINMLSDRPDLPDYKAFRDFLKAMIEPKNAWLIIEGKEKGLLGTNFYLDYPLFYTIKRIFEIDYKPKNDHDYLEFKILLMFYIYNLDIFESITKTNIIENYVELNNQLFKKINSFFINQRFFYSLKRKDRDSALKLHSQLYNLSSSDHYNYLESLIYFEDNDYNKSLAILEKIEKKSIFYRDSNKKILEIKANQGKVDDFIKLIKEFDGKYSEYFIKFLLLKLYSNTNEIFRESIFLDLKDKLIIPIEESQAKQELYDIRTETGKLVLRLKSFIELSKEIGPNNIDEFQLITNKISNLKLLLSVINIDSSFIFLIDNEVLFSKEIFTKFLKIQNVDSFDFKETESLNIDYSVIWDLIINFSNKRLVLERFSDYNSLVTLIKNLAYTLSKRHVFNNNELKLHSEKMDKLENSFILLRSFLFKIYTDVLEYGDIILVNKYKKNFYDLHKNGYIDFEIVHKISKSSFLNISNRSKIALEAAEIYFESIKDKKWVDAGSVSLAFYKILEIEFNHKIVYPIVNKIDFDKLFSKYKQNLENESANGRTINWNFIIQNLVKIKNLKSNGLTAGQIFALLTRLSSHTPPLRDFELYILGILEKNFTLEGLEYFKNRKLFESLNDKFREKYRNPPAHTTYLSLETASDSRNFVYEQLMFLNGKFT